MARMFSSGTLRADLTACDDPAVPRPTGLKDALHLLLHLGSDEPKGITRWRSMSVRKATLPRTLAAIQSSPITLHLAR